MLIAICSFRFVTIKLRVRNTGGSFTNTWSTRTTYYDNNDTGNLREKITTGERYLSANEETTLTYTIENVNRGNTTFTVNIDSYNNVAESNENDNRTSVGIFLY
jgi:subtilase family serine protease